MFLFKLSTKSNERLRPTLTYLFIKSCNQKTNKHNKSLVFASLVSNFEAFMNRTFDFSHQNPLV